jgi:hypothetical protein
MISTVILCQESTTCRKFRFYVPLGLSSKVRRLGYQGMGMLGMVPPWEWECSLSADLSRPRQRRKRLSLGCAKGRPVSQGEVDRGIESE